MELALGYQNRRRFTTKTKYYQYWVQNDLFDLVLVKTWGSLTSRRGNQQSIPVKLTDLPYYYSQIERTRLSHGYLTLDLGEYLVPSSSQPSRLAAL